MRRQIMIKKILFLSSIQLFNIPFLQSMESLDTQESLKAARQKFCKAAAENDLETLTHLHRQHYDWNNHPDLRGIIEKGAAHEVCKSHYAALYHAVMCGNYEATTFLLKTDGIKISLSDDPKKLLHIVCFGRWHEDEEKQKEIVERMLNQSNVNRCIEKDDDSTIEGTPLDVAVSSSAPQSIQKLLFMNGAKHAYALKKQSMPYEKPKSFPFWNHV